MAVLGGTGLVTSGLVSALTVVEIVIARLMTQSRSAPGRLSRAYGTVIGFCIGTQKACLVVKLLALKAMRRRFQGILREKRPPSEAFRKSHIGLLVKLVQVQVSKTILMAPSIQCPGFAQQLKRSSRERSIGSLTNSKYLLQTARPAMRS